MKEVRYTFMDSPIGRLLLAGDDRHLSHLGFRNHAATGVEA